MKKIKTFLQTLPMLLLPMSTLAVQGEAEFCNHPWDGLIPIPILTCSEPAPAVPQTTFSNAENSPSRPKSGSGKWQPWGRAS